MSAEKNARCSSSNVIGWMPIALWIPDGSIKEKPLARRGFVAERAGFEYHPLNGDARTYRVPHK